MEKVRYKCKNCGWEKSLPKDWKDLKPSKCPNKKCNTIFLLQPEKLEVVEVNE